MFTTQRLLMRGYEERKDLDTFCKWNNDADFITLMSDAPVVPSSMDTVRDELKRDAGLLPRFVLCLKPSDWPRPLEAEGGSFLDALPPAIGTLNFHPSRFDYKNRTASCGISIYGQQYRGQGLGREALKWALEYGFLELGLHRFELSVLASNEPAVKLYRSLGFVEEGTQRKTTYNNGQWYDTLLFAMLEEEYAKLRTNEEIH